MKGCRLRRRRRRKRERRRGHVCRKRREGMELMMGRDRGREMEEEVEESCNEDGVFRTVCAVVNEGREK